MKAQSLILGSFLILATMTSQAKSSVVVHFHLDSFTDYVEQSAGVFVGQTDHEKFSLNVDGVDSDGKLVAEAFGPLAAEAPSSDHLLVQGNVIRSESKEGVTIVRANINDEEMRVPSAEMLRVMSEALKAKGKNFVTNLDLKSTEGDSGFKLDVSDLVCKKTVPMICLLSVDMLIRAEK